ncbi:MAG: NAD(P)H-dependent oxidoreductase [Paludibacteraceae bacterium]|nr:NAD(P)H-dependent oxidoreductase [Paludibacteraceae bacterium]
MKEVPTPIHVMRMMHRYIADAYRELSLKEKGVLQFCLTEGSEKINCYFTANGDELTFTEGISDTYNVRLDCSLANWLALADNRLNPVIGVLFRRLKFTGDVSYFKKIIPKDLYAVDLTSVSDKVTAFEVAPSKEWEKPRKVLLLDSSPRGTKGYTKLYCDNMVSFLQEKDVEVNHIMLSQYNIQPCLGCLQCWLKTDGECILKDDVKDLYKLYEESDLIIYAFPLYAYGVPGMLKNFMDRGVIKQYPYFEKGTSQIRHPRRVHANKAFVVFSICGFPSFHQYDAVKPFFKLYSHSSHSPLIAEIYRPGGIFLLQNPFNYLKLKKFMEALRSATHEIIDLGRIQPKTQKRLNSKLDERAFLKSTNKYWDNLYKNKNADY